jgi:hypothetical protein
MRTPSHTLPRPAPQRGESTGRAGCPSPLGNRDAGAWHDHPDDEHLFSRHASGQRDAAMLLEGVLSEAGD